MSPTSKANATQVPEQAPGADPTPAIEGAHQVDDGLDGAGE